MTIKRILVPIDFTSVCDIAIKHAIMISKLVDSEIYLLHVVSNDSKAHHAKEKLADLVEHYKVEFPKIFKSVRVGGLNNEINHASFEIEADLIVMGTHEIKGIFQKITGGDAIKVITSTDKPFILVQENINNINPYNHIAVPLDINDDSKQKLDEVLIISKIFKSKVHVFLKKELDADLKIALKNNIIFTKNYFENNGVDYNIEISENTSNFDEQLLEFAFRNECDLISIINTSKWNVFGNLFSSKREDYIISNKYKIPVMCINPKDVTGDYSM